MYSGYCGCHSETLYIFTFRDSVFTSVIWFVLYLLGAVSDRWALPLYLLCRKDTCFGFFMFFSRYVPALHQKASSLFSLVVFSFKKSCCSAAFQPFDPTFCENANLTDKAAFFFYTINAEKIRWFKNLNSMKKYKNSKRNFLSDDTVLLQKLLCFSISWFRLRSNICNFSNCCQAINRLSPEAPTQHVFEPSGDVWIIAFAMQLYWLHPRCYFSLIRQQFETKSTN